MTGETRIQGTLDAVTSPHTFERWDENTGTLHTFRRWDGETGKMCNAVHEGRCERYGWNTILQWHRIAGSAAAVEDKRKGSRKERKEDGKRLYGECGGSTVILLLRKEWEKRAVRRPLRKEARRELMGEGGRKAAGPQSLRDSGRPHAQAARPCAPAARRSRPDSGH